MLVRMDESFLRRRDVNIGMTFPRRKEMLLRYLNLPIFVHSSAHLWIKVSSEREESGDFRGQNIYWKISASEMGGREMRESLVSLLQFQNPAL